MKLLYCSVILLITLVVAVQNAMPPKGDHLPNLDTYCSPECEYEFFPNLIYMSRMWANIYLPLPKSEQQWNITCSTTTEFLACSKLATPGCREGRAPMLRLAQVRNAYGYLCEEGTQDFLNVLPCLGEHYKQEDTEKCVKQKNNKRHRGPDEDFCIELGNYQDCIEENAMKKCGKNARDFMSIFVQKTHQVLKKYSNCDKYKN